MLRCGPVLLLMACDVFGTTGVPQDTDGAGAISPGTVAPTPVAPATERLSIELDGVALFPGMRRRLYLNARATNGQPMPTDDAFLEVSGAGGVVLESVQLYDLEEASGRRTRQQTLLLRFDSTGRAQLRVTLRSMRAELTVDIAPLPPPSTALVVDSFYVAEYRPACAFDCPYLVYVPVLKLREPTGVLTAEVLGVEFSIPTHTSGMCRGDRPFRPGAVHHLNGQFEYLWSNDLLFVSLDGTPVPDGDAHAEVLVRDHYGRIGLLQVVGPLRRMLVNPVFAPPEWPELGWAC